MSDRYLLKVLFIEREIKLVEFSWNSYNKMII